MKKIFLLAVLALLQQNLYAEDLLKPASTNIQLPEEKPELSRDELKAALIQATQNDPEKTFLVKGDKNFVDLEREQERLVLERDKISTTNNVEQEIIARLTEMKDLANQLNKEVGKKVTASDHLKQLVTLYESINAEQATQILKQLPTSMSVSILSMMNPKKSSKILAAMEPYLAADMSRRLLKEPQKVAVGGAK